MRTPHPIKVKRLSFLIALILLIIGPGCIQPDHWSVFEPPVSQTNVKETTLSAPKIIEKQIIEKKLDTPPPTPLLTGSSLSLSLDQALVMALESSPGLRVARYTPVLAGLAEQIERGRFDPELFSELSYAKQRTQENDEGTWTREGEQIHTAVVGLSQKLPSGTDITASAAQTLEDTYHGSEEHKLRIGMTVTQSLLQGYGSDVNLASIRQAQLNTAATLYELRGITEALMADTERAYWDHVLARQEIDIFENSLEVAKKQLSEVEQRIEIGTLPRVEAATAKVEVALREQALINAKAKFEESRLRLLFYIHPGKDQANDPSIQTTSQPPPDPQPEGNAKDHLELADKYRSDLQETRLQIRQNRLEIVKTRNGVLPRLDLFINLGNSGYADSFSSSFKALNDYTYDLSGGIRFSRTLGNRTAEARKMAAKVTLDQTREALENLKQIIQRDVRIALNDLDRLGQQITATRATRILQEESAQAEIEKYEAGTSTGLLVAQAQRDLLATIIREVQAIIDYQKGLVTLYLSEGSLLERRGVDMAPL
jgi:outer membrane protein